MKIYNLTGITGSESINIMSSENNGRELILCSAALSGIQYGDTLLLDRPYFKSVAFKVEGVRYLLDHPEHLLIYIKIMSEHIGGSKEKLKLKYLKNKILKAA